MKIVRFPREKGLGGSCASGFRNEFIGEQADRGIRPIAQFTFLGDNAAMSKKIDAALKSLIKALEKHADAVGGSRVSAKKSGRASAKLQSAAADYAEAVFLKSGLETPFSDVVRPGLDPETMKSLTAERDKLTKKRGH